MPNRYIMKDACVHESCNRCSPTEEEKEFGCLATFWFVTFVMLLHTTRCVVQCWPQAS